MEDSSKTLMDRKTPKVTILETPSNYSPNSKNGLSPVGSSLRPTGDDRRGSYHSSKRNSIQSDKSDTSKKRDRRFSRHAEILEENRGLLVCNMIVGDGFEEKMREKQLLPETMIQQVMVSTKITLFFINFTKSFFPIQLSYFCRSFYNEPILLANILPSLHQMALQHFSTIL